ncbi:MAG: hypothetical protein MJZ13_09670 [Bacteroidales bacterium]|nr:hypothetical protein [Bacteroidales bacterium]
MIRNILNVAAVIAALLQTTIVFSQANIKPAISLFDKGQYEECAQALESVITSNERDAKTNYYLGASYVMLNKNVSEGIRRLKFSQVKGFVANSHFYLGRAYQLQYEYEQATVSFDKFLKTAKSDKLIALANTYRTQCQNSIPLASKIFQVRVIDKYRVTPDSLLNVYNPSKEVGTIQRNKSFFESDIDPDGVLYRTERGDEVFFSVTNSNNKEKLFKMERLLDGWSEMGALTGLESEANDQMPVMMTDGTTLYFTSDRPGGMGGFDIYRTTYDQESKTFTEPVNLGVPFNSPFDDYLFVGDEFRKRAWFASNRETTNDSLVVYEILWDESVIRSFAQNTEEIRQVASLKIDKSLARLRDNVTAAGVNKSTFSVTREEKKFEFQVNDSLKYTQWEHFRSEEARKMYHAALAIEHQKDSLAEKMASLRKEFQRVKTDDQRNDIIADVLKIERVVYNMEDDLELRYDRVRRAENTCISDLVASGKYMSLSQVDLKHNAPVFNWDEILDPSKFEMYSNVPFEEIRAKNEGLYKAVFSDDEIEDLQEADSLYIWAGLLALEVSRIEDDEQATFISQASVMLYSKAFDQKFDIFDDRYLAAIDKEPNIDFTEITVLRKSAVRDFNLVENVRLENGLEAMHNASVMKKRGMNSYTEAMTRYASHVDGSFPLPNKVTSSEPMSVVASFNAIDETTAKRGDTVFTIDAASEKQIEEIVDKEETVAPAVQPVKKAEEPAPAPVAEVKEVKAEEPVKAAVAVSDATVSPYGASKPVYRIQLGVFRNKPDAAKLSVFSEVTTVEIPEKGLTKYYGGAYATYTEAQAALKSVSGFSGAFIVSFLNGQQVKLSVAQKAE